MTGSDVVRTPNIGGVGDGSRDVRGLGVGATSEDVFVSLKEGGDSICYLVGGLMIVSHS